MCVIKRLLKLEMQKSASFDSAFMKEHRTQLLLTSVMARTVYCGVILLVVPLWVLLFTRKRCAHFCYLTSVPTESARVHGAPV